MKGLAELQAENDALVSRAEAKQRASLRRLKQRIARVMWRPEDRRYRSSAFRAIDEWAAKERKR